MDDDQIDYYTFKLINRSLYSAYDIKIELLEIDRYSTRGGQNNRIRPLTLVLNSVSYLPGYRPSSIRKDAPYALRVRTTEDIYSILKNDYKCVKIQISLRHGLTGLVKVYSEEFSELTQIKEGKFKYGRKLDCM